MLSGFGLGLGGVTRREGVGVLNALSPLRAKLDGDTADAAILGVGDSTSASDTRIFKPLATYLAGRYPKFTVVYYPPDGSGGFTTPVTIQTGTGTHTLYVYNCSVSGTRAQQFMGGAFDTAFITPGRQWDVVWWNHGKNHVAGFGQALVEGELLAALAETQLRLELAGYPRPNMVVTDQYPNRDDTAMDLASTCWQDIVASAPEITRLNLKTGATYVSGDFTDNPHLTDAAYLAKIDPLVQALWAGTRAGAWTAPAPWLATASSPNLLFGDSNERITDFNEDGTSGSVAGAVAGSGAPFGLSLNGSVTFTKDTSVKFGSNTRSQKAIAVSGSQPRLTRAMTSTRLNTVKTKRVVFTALKFIETGAAAGVGRVGANINGTGGPGALTSRSGGSTKNGWTVDCIGPMTVPSDATSGSFTYYIDSAASPDTTHSVNYQWSSLAEGGLPRGT